MQKHQLEVNLTDNEEMDFSEGQVRIVTESCRHNSKTTRQMPSDKPKTSEPYGKKEGICGSAISEKKFKVCTWNLWCVPFGSPRTLSNPYRCAKYAANIAKLQKWKEFDGLIIFHLQELWAFKTGIFPPFLLWCVSCCLFQFLALLLGLLPILKCLPLMYNPKRQFAQQLRKYLPYTVEHSQVPWTCGFDNGLLMCFNKPPQKHGFQRFTSHRCDDSFAAKGFLWAYFQDLQLLVINTHLQVRFFSAGSGKERENQLNQLKKFIDSVREHMSVLIAGDFNIDCRSNALRLYRLEQMKRIHFDLQTNYEGSTTNSLSGHHHRGGSSNSSNDPSHPTDTIRDAMHGNHTNGYNSHDDGVSVNEHSTSPQQLLSHYFYEDTPNETLCEQAHSSGNASNATKNENMPPAVSINYDYGRRSHHFHLHSYYTYCNLERAKFTWPSISDCHVSNECNQQILLYLKKEDLPDETPATLGDVVIPASSGHFLPSKNIDKESLARRKDKECGRCTQKNLFTNRTTLGMKKINLYEPTFKRRDWSIDYVLVDFPVASVKNSTFGRRSGLSDHFLILTDFVRSK
ncbi:hypothetical protein RFI_21842 [Reticulomyxa filosa]|uniref:Endonuclease/exonuclease/phosphatase domain-containing protein n=1 Tax=Reticulomyxa filosa TaxID=46433 RepID=X6MQZ5_RETFI|nr:hypothetical protein RFI_21842 [Reticulomyxa filosa]|eukprot:ETO15520.1 hypothetical protein RFI_21842 [Reticulomyxa filosa]